MTWTKCEHCYGTGLVDCIDCDGLDEDCYECNGEGSVECPDCFGDGEIEEDD